MQKPIIYFDNAATSFPKPELVYQAADLSLRRAGNPGRGAHQLALASARAVFEARTALASFLGLRNEHSYKVIFTPGCTQSINMVLRGISFKKDDVVFVSALEHNAVMRPLHELKRTVGIQIHQLSYAPRRIVALNELNAAVQKYRPRLCVFTDASNVTGEKLDLEGVSELCRNQRVELLIDAAQTAGTICNTLRHEGITFWAAPGHKSLLGSPGVGILYCGSEQLLDPLVRGGTGSGSEKFEMPQLIPDRLEAGSLPTTAIAALAAGVDFIQEIGVKAIVKHESHLAQSFRHWCLERAWIKLAGKTFESDFESERLAPVVSFSTKHLSPDVVVDRLDRDYGIALRAGLHCAAAAHQSLGSTQHGLVRASFGFFNTLDELDQLCTALTELHAHAVD